MKLLLLVFALFLFVSQAQQSERNNNFRILSTSQKNEIVTGSPLYSKLLEFGLRGLAKKALISHGVQFLANPEHKVHSVRTDRGKGLEVTFEADVRDVLGKYHRVTFLVVYQSWKNILRLESYTVSK